MNNCNKDNCDSTTQTIRFLESTGIYRVCQSNKKILIESAIIAGPTKQKDVTCALKEYNIQLNCQSECFYVNTGMLNIYPGCDVEFGYRKAIYIKYTVDEKCHDNPCYESNRCTKYEKIRSRQKSFNCVKKCN